MFIRRIRFPILDWRSRNADWLLCVYSSNNNLEKLWRMMIKSLDIRRSDFQKANVNGGKQQRKIIIYFLVAIKSNEKRRVIPNNKSEKCGASGEAATATFLGRKTCSRCATGNRNEVHWIRVAASTTQESREINCGDVWRRLLKTQSRRPLPKMERSSDSLWQRSWVRSIQITIFSNYKN